MKKLAKGEQRTVCMRGIHLMTPDNIYIAKSTGRRYCRECRKVTRSIRDGKKQYLPLQTSDPLSRVGSYILVAIDTKTWLEYAAECAYKDKDIFKTVHELLIEFTIKTRPPVKKIEPTADYFASDSDVSNNC